ncbi:hypothetical protein [Geothrix edaphica]|uniref:Uncharacterized protein n=1 Tax=Geothrix edaphica TaxID=2927976 RepID=A0ABQ5PWD0_9BACT|nr:hypothetical protein [Geothrix edaphica]GLH66420.1 hypothetical protein GETHED_07840 [Geothrix edaphica]
MTWRPRSREGEGHASLPLDARQGFLLSRLDGTLDIPTLASLMGLEEPELEGMLTNLVALGAVEPGPDAGPRASIQDPPVEHAEGEEDAPTAAALAATHRQLFERRLHPQPVDERVAQARVAVEPELSAFCFDPTAEVVRAVLENPRVGSLHARLIAAHHRTSAGLEALGGRTAFTNDGGVRRSLLQNPLLPVGLYRRLWSTRRLLEQYLVATSRDAPEQVRAMARDLLRASFTQRTGEEKAELIFTTEGRCLASLVGLTLDGHATALLCRRTYVSTLLIQNIARWSAAPPQLIAHLRRQDAVKRNAPLRQLLERHPNAS